MASSGVVPVEGGIELEGDGRRGRSAEEYRARLRAAVEHLGVAIDRDGVTAGGHWSDEADLVAAAAQQVVDTLVAVAYDSHASDIHLDFHHGRFQVRMRVDGSFLQFDDLSSQIGQRVCNTLITHAGLDPCHRRSPQDGRLTFQHSGRSLSLRIATIPTIDGMKITLRFIGATQERRELDGLGFDPGFVSTLDRLLAQPSGVILFTGPCSSGKSTTMYAALQRIQNRYASHRSLITLEDPVELYTGTYPQVAINPKAGLTYSRALRSVLRHDPDVIMVGEIRGRATARLVLQSGLTGHLVLSTLHAGRAPLVFSRLARMGLDGFLLGSTIRAAVGLRLVRTLCPEPTHLGLRKITPLPLAEARTVSSCPSCLGTGFSSRQPIAEVLEVRQDIQQALINGADPATLDALARKTGFSPLEDELTRLIQAGRTTPEEAARVLGG